MNKTQGKRDLLTFALLWIGSVVLYTVLIPSQISLNSSVSGNTGFNSQTFPRLLAIALFVVSTLGVIQSVRKILAAKNEQAAEDGAKKTLFTRLLPLLTYIVCVVYVLLFQSVGFLIATLVVSPGMLLLFSGKKWYYFVSVYTFGAFLYVVFRILLKVPIP